ncbi:MAG: PKD domain-containing protein [Candidatus Saccharibacteria bacterium]
MKKSVHLAFRIIFALVLFSIPLQVTAATQTASGSVTINGIVPGPPPATPPTIDSPTQGQNFDVKNISVSGGCIVGLLVKVFDNNIFAGSTLCQAGGTWSLQIDLNIGRNDLIARQYDTLNQSSPDSDTVTVYYVPPSISPSIPGDNTSPPVQTAEFELRINYDYTVIGVFPGQPFRLPISFYGGTPPYAVSIDWGDGSTSLYSRSNSKEFVSEHIYKEAGYKTVTIKVTDAEGNTAYLQFVLVVNGRVNSPFAVPIFDGGRLAIAWPILGLTVGVGAGIAAGILLERHYLVRRKKRKNLQ